MNDVDLSKFSIGNTINLVLFYNLMIKVIRELSDTGSLELEVGFFVDMELPLPRHAEFISASQTGLGNN